MTTDTRMLQFIQSVGPQLAVVPYRSEDDENIRHFVWLLDIPRDRLCDIEDKATELAFQIYGDDPLPFLIGVATPEKTKLLGYTTSKPPTSNECVSRPGASIGSPIGRNDGFPSLSRCNVITGTSSDAPSVSVGAPITSSSQSLGHAA